jgi:hypothetical protein
MESRTFTRVSTVHPATVTTADGVPQTGRLRDVALAGVFITGLSLPLAASVTLTIELGAGACIQAEGTVSRVAPDGIGIALQLLAGSESALHLRNLVLYNTRTLDETSTVVGEISRVSGLKAVDLQAPPPT